MVFVGLTLGVVAVWLTLTSEVGVLVVAPPLATVALGLAATVCRSGRPSDGGPK